MKPRLRYAPSPTGVQHIGGIRTLLFNYLYARHNEGSIILRIEDTDSTRSKQEFVDDILGCADLLSLSFDELLSKGPHAPYIQSQRADVYLNYCQKLLESGMAYYCYTSEENQFEATDVRTGYNRSSRNLSKEEIANYQSQGILPVVRLKAPLEGECRLVDGIVGEISWNYKDISPDPILLKKDGLPTYHLANVVDDHLMQITDVFRSQEWLSSTPIHLFLYDAFGWSPPNYFHLPLVLGEDGKKLSKRHGAEGVTDLLKKGYFPQTLINTLVLLGWSYDDSREFFSLDELIQLFNAEGISRSPAVFNYQKMDWFNQHYIQAMDVKYLASLLDSCFLQSFGSAYSQSQHAHDQDFLEACAELVRERITFVHEASDLLGFLFDSPDIEQSIRLHQKKFSTQLVKTHYQDLAILLDDILAQTFVSNSAITNAVNIEDSLRKFCEERACSFGKLLMSLRIVLTGSTKTPPILPILLLLKREHVIEVIKKAKAYVEKQNLASASQEQKT